MERSTSVQPVKTFSRLYRDSPWRTNVSRYGMDAQSTVRGPEFSENVLDSSGYTGPAIGATDAIDAIDCSVDACEQVSSHIHTNVIREY